MSVVNNIDLTYSMWTSYESIHSELIRFQAFQVIAPGCAGNLIMVFPLSDLYFAFNVIFT